MDEINSFPIIDFTDWEILHLPASGIRKKKWLLNTKTKEVGLFKYPKTEQTGDFWAEKLAYELGKLISIEVARTEIGIYDGQIGSFSYNILNDGEYLLEGYSIIGDALDFSTSSEIYSTVGLNYSIELLENVLNNHFKTFLQVIIFDCLIGNTDRHHGNWAFITDDNNVWLKISPLYDNGSSLCYLEKPDRIDLMQKDKMMLEAALFSKSKSQIGLGNTRPVNHFELFSYVSFKYNKEMKQIIDRIEREITDRSVSYLLGLFGDNIIDDKIKQFIKLFLIKRKERMLHIFDKGLRRMEVF